jgi:hypothetical protein
VGWITVESRPGSYKEEMRRKEELWKLARSQSGAFSRDQALKHVSERQLEKLVASGELERLDRCTYGVPGAPASFYRSVMVATLRTGGVACGRTAASLWGIPGFPLRDAELEVLVPASRRPRRHKGVTVRRTNYLPDDDVTLVRGIPVTSPARTLLMLGSTEAAATVRRAIIWCIQHHLVSADQLREQLKQAGRCGRNGTSGLRAAIEFLDFEQELTDSDLEDVALSALGEAGYPEPLLHHRCLDDGVLVGEIDLFWTDRHLGLECYGWTFHNSKPDFHRGFHRHNSIVAAGVTLLYFTAESAYDPRRFLNDFGRVWRRLGSFVDRRPPQAGGSGP